MTAAADSNSDGTLTEEELTALTIAKLRELAAEKGITLTATTKAAIIAEILAALNDSGDDAGGGEAEGGT